ncbi:hypothetical protein BH23GEM6_BH23GEM6_10900 [soil metagenome]
MRSGFLTVLVLAGTTCMVPTRGEASPPSTSAAPYISPAAAAADTTPALLSPARLLGEPIGGEPDSPIGLAAAPIRTGLILPRRAGGYCTDWQPLRFSRNPSRAELFCRHGVPGPGRFGLLAYLDVPVYQPATPMPGTHLAGVPGHAQPLPWESFEEWEWRVHRTEYPGQARVALRSLELLDPAVASRIMTLESRLAQEGIRFTRRETWRSPERQAFLFQQGRSRPGPIATATLTSWHGQMDERGQPAGRAVDYSVPFTQMPRFHEVARELGLTSFGADSNDPGHVFLPVDDPIASLELQMLRLLPRVPEVTLTTGIAVDQQMPFGGRAALREAVARWVAEPFIPHIIPEVSGALPLPEPVLNTRGHGPP